MERCHRNVADEKGKHQVGVTLASNTEYEVRAEGCTLPSVFGTRLVYDPTRRAVLTQSMLLPGGRYQVPSVPLHRSNRRGQVEPAGSMELYQRRQRESFLALIWTSIVDFRRTTGAKSCCSPKVDSSVAEREQVWH
eukprot:3903880-Rhodomonas_salina.1